MVSQEGWLKWGYRDKRGRKLQLCIIIITIRLWFSFSPLPHLTLLPLPSPARSATGSPAEERSTIWSTQMHACRLSAKQPCTCMVAHERINTKLPETRLFLFLGILGQCLLAKPRRIPLRWSPYHTGWQSNAATCLQCSEEIQRFRI